MFSLRPSTGWWLRLVAVALGGCLASDVAWAGAKAAPQPLPSVTEAARCEGAPCNRRQRALAAVARGAAWLAAYGDELRFDAALILSQVRESFDSATLRAAFEKARVVADEDVDHPQRRFWVPTFRSPKSATSEWKAPTDGTRINTNRLIDEALHCVENGWREQSQVYACGPMRDDGGYYTAHALWGLSILLDLGCVTTEQLEPCLSSVRGEMIRAQPTTLEPERTLDIDLYAERALTLVLSGFWEPTVDSWVDEILRHQGDDGSWGVALEEERPYFRYHATGICVWTLSEWLSRAP